MKFSNDADIPNKVCEQLIKKHMRLSDRKAKMDQMLFVKYAHIICMLCLNKNHDHLHYRYMFIRCQFLDGLESFNYNQGRGEIIQSETRFTDTKKLGSTLMACMLEEVNTLFDPEILRNWSSKVQHKVTL